MQEKIVYLGFMILTNGLKMDPKKVKAILEWPTAENVDEVISFHGLASKNFNVVCNSMTKTMRGDKKDFKWTHGADKSFEALKHKVVELPILALLDFNKVFKVEFDASGSEIGAILSHEGNPVAFFSEKLNDAKRKYFVYDQEFYVMACIFTKLKF